MPLCPAYTAFCVEVALHAQRCCSCVVCYILQCSIYLASHYLMLCCLPVTISGSKLKPAAFEAAIQTTLCKVKTPCYKLKLSNLPNLLPVNNNNRFVITCHVVQPVMDYTESQIDDMMCMRRFLYCKLGVLARQRRAVLTKMTWSHVDCCHPSDKLSKLSTWAEQLRENGAEEYRTYTQYSVAMFRGVGCTAHALCH